MHCIKNKIQEWTYKLGEILEKGIKCKYWLIFRHDWLYQEDKWNLAAHNKCTH